MPRPINFGNILGGVNYTTPPNELPPFYVADAQNVVSVLNGYAAPRGGSSKFNSTAYGTLITSFHELIVSGTSYKFASQGTVIGKATTGNFSNHITGLTTGLYGQWVNYGDYAIYVNGTDKPQKTDGTTGNDLTADQGGMAAGSCIAEWGERIWIAVGNTLYGSALRDPTDFVDATTSTGFWEGTIGSGKQDITGVFSFFDVLLIGKLNQMYQLTGAPETDSDTFRLIPIQTKDKDSFGFTSKTAITQVGNDLIFLDGFLIKSLAGISAYGDVETVNIVGNIKDYLRDSSGAGLDKDHLQKSHFFHYKHKEQIWCSIPTAASTRYWFVIDYSNQALRQAIGLPRYSFYPMSGLTPICFGGVENGTRVDIYAGCEDGFVRQLDTGTNDTDAAVDSHITWCWGDPERSIEPAHVLLNVKYDTACTIQPSYAMGIQDWQSATDSSNFTDLTEENLTGSSWITQNDVAHKKISDFFMNTDRSFAFKIRHNTAGETFELRTCTFRYRPKYDYING